MKKFNIILSILFIFIFTSPSLSYTEVKIQPADKISTSDPAIKEGCYANFIVAENVFCNNKLLIKKGTPVQGLITYVEPNGFGGLNAKITIEQFETKDISNRTVKLHGSIFKHGNSHDAIFQFMPFDLMLWPRGGEVQLKPECDCFKLFFKETI